MSASYEMIDGFRCYAPAVAREGTDYPLDGFEVTAAVEARSFWCRSRNRIVRHLFDRFVARDRPVDVLEIGCGIGGVIQELRRIPNLRLTGSEVYLQGLKYARQKLPDVQFIQLDATDIPFSSEFDVICAFDVIEHIDADVRVMAEVYDALRPGGLFLITVPQYAWMWGRLDEIVQHKRRYSRSELHRKLLETGFHIQRTSSFVSFLFPFMLASRLRDRFRSAPTGSETVKAEFDAQVNLPRPLNWTFDKVMRGDEFLIRCGVDLPFGGSLLTVACRPDNLRHR